ncbi:hypothetical protein [Methylobacterium planeticum]|uniref:Uncharacterized protein n=1 Tax=Methylobacterium planeticum TaxID=2615211 RepID=A0A6N6MI34_9HYPH|nr:hypothetical protein [Methylobacterium planeticum]KAB1069575.1 hypothetical protein F6X51_25030 [Methylobacterium planeticum]
MVEILIVSLLAGGVLAPLISIVLFAFLSLLVLGIALAFLPLPDALSVFAGLQAGYVGGLVLRACVVRLRDVRFRAATGLTPRDEQAAGHFGAHDPAGRSLGTLKR